MTNSLIKFLNYLTDQDWGWRPFLYLRPPKEQYITTKYVAKMAIHFGTLIWILILILDLASGNSVTIDTFSRNIVFCYLGFFIGYRLTFAIAWNIRAKKLRELSSC